MTFFHNVESAFASMKIRLAGPQYIPGLFSDRYNERLSVKYADTLIAINERDKLKLEKIYKRPIDGILSTIWFEDDELVEIQDNTPVSKPLEALFLGAWFYANTAGITWFIQNVLPLAAIRLTVAGKGMEKLRGLFAESEKLRIIGTVKDIEKVYRFADCVIAPIFDGSGMKVKTGMALRYGKTVVGTREAFTGYHITHGQEGYVCETVNEFLKAFEEITKLQETKVNRASFRYSREHLSKSAALEKLQNIFSLPFPVDRG
jgi:glycosyltransferase involved in cell wall biosynthesis